MSVIIKNERTQAILATMQNTIIGTGGATSASKGEIMVAILAKILHIPKAVPANIVGNI